MNFDVESTGRGLFMRLIGVREENHEICENLPSETESSRPWIDAPSRLVEVYRSFGDACCLHHQIEILVGEQSSPGLRDTKQKCFRNVICEKF